MQSKDVISPVNDVDHVFGTLESSNCVVSKEGVGFRTDPTGPECKAVTEPLRLR